MGDRKGHARKLEPGEDVWAAGPSEPESLSIADRSDSEILDNQAVLDILDSGTFPLPDQPTADSRDGRKDVDDTDTSLPDGDLTRNIHMNDYLSRLEQEVETIHSDTLRGTSRMQRSPTVKTSWMQRVLSWFRRI